MLACAARPHIWCGCVYSVTRPHGVCGYSETQRRLVWSELTCTEADQRCCSPVFKLHAVLPACMRASYAAMPRCRVASTQMVLFLSPLCPGASADSQWKPASLWLLSGPRGSHAIVGQVCYFWGTTLKNCFAPPPQVSKDKVNSYGIKSENRT